MGFADNTGRLYHSRTSKNTGTFTNTGARAVVSYAGPSTGTFSNSGSYTASAGATDQFLGPSGGVGPQELAGTTAPSFYNLILANGQSFNVTNTAGFDVANTLTLQNGRTTTTNAVAGAIRLGSGATNVAGALGATAGYIDGYLAKAGTSPFTYPLGAFNQNATSMNDPTPQGGVVYSPITLSEPSSTAIKYIASPAPNNTSHATGDTQLLVSVSGREYYVLGNASVPVGSTISIPYNNFGPTGYVGSISTLTIAALNSATNQWENLSNTATNPTSNNKVTVTLNKNLSASYSALALATTTSNNPLPVQLTTFTATTHQTDALLSWTTASELRNDHFEVERSVDGSSFSAIEKIPGQGSKLTATSYTYTDNGIGERVAGRAVYYRLRQVDLDGKAAFSPVKVVQFNVLVPALRLYPTPASAETMLDLALLPAGSYHMRVLDATGRSVLSQQVDGGTAYHLSLHELSSGVYCVVVQGQELTLATRLLKE